MKFSEEYLFLVREKKTTLNAPLVFKKTFFLRISNLTKQNKKIQGYKKLFNFNIFVISQLITFQN